MWVKQRNLYRLSRAELPHRGWGRRGVWGCPPRCGRDHCSQEVCGVPVLRTRARSAPRALPPPQPVVHAASACAAPSQLVSARAKKPGSRSELSCRLRPARCQHEQPRPECPRSPPRQARCPIMSAGGRCHAGWGWGATPMPRRLWRHLRVPCGR